MEKENLVKVILQAVSGAKQQNELAKELGVKIQASGLLSDLDDALQECGLERLKDLSLKYAAKAAEMTDSKIDQVVGRVCGS